MSNTAGTTHSSTEPKAPSIPTTANPNRTRL